MFSNIKAPTLIIGFLLILFIVAAWLGYNQLDTKSINPMQAFPKNTAFVLEIPEPAAFFKKLNNQNAFWQDLLSNKKTEEFNQFFNELLAQSKDEEKLKLFFNQPFYITTFPNQESTNDFLLITKQSEISLKSMNSMLISKLKGIKYTAPNKDTSYAKIQTNSVTYFLSESNGLFFISNNSGILQEVQKQILEKKPFTESADFKKLITTRGKRADAFLYAAYATSDDILKNLLSQQGIQLKISSFANFSVLDILLKKDALLLNGYTSANDSLNHFLATFQNQTGQKSKLAASLPYSTQSFIAYNLSDYSSFIQKQTKFSQLQKSQANIDQMIQRNALDITSSWWAGEMALVIDENQSEYAVFTTKSGIEAFELLSDIANQSQPRIIRETYHEQDIKELNSPDFLISQFGTLFSGFKEVYFCVIDETVIFSKSINELKNYIDKLISGNNLSKNAAYIEFSDNLSDDAIIRIYSKTPQANLSVFNYLASKGKPLFENYGNLIKHTKGIGIQISNKNNLFYTGLFVNYGTNPVEKLNAWQVELQAPIAAGPFLVTNHDTEGGGILVQDEFNTLYFLNANGDIVWREMLKEKISSQVFAIDYFKNGKYQYLFNSPNFLYLIDLNGKMVENYPVQLNSEATNELQVIDYDNNKDYRLFIAGKNGEVYNYEINGHLLNGWKAENTRKIINKPITHLVANKKDYVIFEASNGNIIMTDRRGDKRIEVRTAFTNALGSDIYVNKTNSKKGIMLTTDLEGNIVYISESGKVSNTTFDKMSENHFFLYADFNKDNEMDFIYLDEKKLRIYDKFKKLVLTFDFNNPILMKPALFSFNNKIFLGVVDQTEKQLYLFNKNGLLKDKTRKGNTPFITGKLNQNGAPSLIIGLDKSVYNYPLD